MTPRGALFQGSGTSELAVRRSLCKQSAGCRLRNAYDYSSGPPTLERKLPQAHRRFRLKPWQRFLVLGALTGAGGSAAYGLYSDRQSRDGFIPYKLVKKDPVSSTASIFVLRPQDDSRDVDRYKEAWQKGIWNVHFKQPQLQIVRPYTPLPSQNGQAAADDGGLRFLIRNDHYGEVSSYLHRLPIGSQIELRGPNLEYEISHDVKQIVFFAGGTGIAPALQVAHALFNSTEHGKDKKLHILWANRKREDCVGGRSDDTPAEPMALKSKITSIFAAPRPSSKLVSDNQGLVVKELEQLKERYPEQVTVEYFVNEENSFIDKDSVFKALSRFDDRDFSLGSSSPKELRQILISGPNGFISYLAGPKEWRNGKEQQGGISKILAHAISMNPHSVKVWKV